MSYEQLTDPVFITNVATIIGFIVVTVLTIKQRAKLIFNAISAQKKDEEIENQNSEIVEKDYELQVLGQNQKALLELMNLIIQASKMSASDKASAMEMIADNKHNIEKLINEKIERINNFKEKYKEAKNNPEQALNLLVETGTSVLEEYTSK